MQALYQADVGSVPIEDAINYTFDEVEYIKETRDFTAVLARGAWADKKKADKVIGELAHDWALDRIGAVDRNVLRLAIWELDQGETPSSVIINEAVELAKKFSGPESAKFINGVLGAYFKKYVQKPA